MKIICKKVFTIKTDAYSIMIVASDIKEAMSIFQSHRPTTEILCITFTNNVLINKENL